ncbi:MAG TPA: protein kinase [Polyangiaceae bacterium]|nr:protein kinase [Polyangiaceae bacterium]
MTPIAARRVVGRYLLCDAIASGGMATVHLARLMGPEGFSRTVAVKQLHPQFSRDPEFVAMFLDEARLASRVRHPNVVSPLDVISSPPELFIVMDYVHGASLSRLLKRATPKSVPPRVAAAIVGQVLLGLHAAHEATGEGGESLELVHRDVSPQNIMVSKDGVARIVDFGVAKAKARSHQTDPGKLKGKLGYMSPEQLNFDTIDRRSDVFAVGVVLWELLAGQRLFSSDSPGGAVHKLLHAEIEAPSRFTPGVPLALDRVVLQALSRPVAERFESARAMAEALEQAVAPCSMLELATWVESLVGDELGARADLVSDVESLSFDEFTRALPQSSALGLPEPRNAPLQANERLDEQATPAQLYRAFSEHRRGRFGKGWLVPVTVTIAVIVLLSWGRARRAPPIAMAPVVAAHAALPAEPVTADATVPGPALSTSARPDAASAAQSAPLESPKQHKPAAKAAASVRVKPANDCDVPYEIDQNGVKRFKEACF